MCICKLMILAGVARLDVGDACSCGNAIVSNVCTQGALCPAAAAISLPTSLPTCAACCVLCPGPVAEQVLLLENIATSIKTGPNQLPTIHNLLLEAVSSLVTWQLSMDRAMCLPKGLQLCVAIQGPTTVCVHGLLNAPTIHPVLCPAALCAVLSIG